jgi:heptosyltransferase-2
MKKILIVKLGAIGDVVMTLSAFQAIDKSTVAIDWVCGAAAYPLLKCYSWISPILVDDRAILTGTFAERFPSLLRLWHSLLGKRYDLCATLSYDSRYKVLALPVLATRKIILSRRSRTRFLIPGRNHSDEYARILFETGDASKPTSLVPCRPDCLPQPPLGRTAAPVRVAIVPAGASNLLRQQILRRWPVDSYVELAQTLIDRGWEVLILGGKDDVWVRPHFEHLGVTDCLGTFSLPEVIALFDTCDAVISHDTGPLHLAGLSFAAIIGLFGPTDPGNFLPRREYVTGIWGGAGFACRPCYDGRDFAPCKNNGCMQQISPTLVLRELDKLLERKANGLPSPQSIVFPESELIRAPEISPAPG